LYAFIISTTAEADFGAYDDYDDLEINGGDRVEQLYTWKELGKEKEDDDREKSRPGDGSTFLTQ
jgi:hypothetical protein